jgi:hypothetical protein
LVDDVRIEPATEQHAEALAPLLRDADREEIWTAQRLTALEGLLVALRRSQIARCGFVNGEITAMWGVIAVSLLSGTGQPWLLTSGAVERYPKIFMRECYRQLEEFKGLFPTMMNVMDARYTRAARWASRIGFDVSPPYLFGPVGKMMPHRLIEMRA